MNAFELAAFMSGVIINRVADVKIGKMISTKAKPASGIRFENSEQFTSNHSPEDIVKNVRCFFISLERNIKIIVFFDEFYTGAT